jgi:hypothetical protein
MLYNKILPGTINVYQHKNINVVHRDLSAL